MTFIITVINEVVFTNEKKINEVVFTNEKEESTKHYQREIVPNSKAETVDSIFNSEKKISAHSLLFSPN
jgi:hypothetical protein